MDMVFFKIALVASLLGSICYLVSLMSKRVLAAKLGTWVLLLVWFFLTISFGFRCVTTGASNLLTQHGVLAFFAWAISAGYLAMQLKTNTRLLGVLVAPVVSIVLLAAARGAGAELPMSEPLQGSLVVLHVILTLTGEALLVISSTAGGMYLIQNEAIKKKRISRLTRLLPSLTDLDRINHFSLLTGFPLLTLGIIIGSLWASSVISGNWQVDPKFIWAALAWLLYGILIYQRLLLGWKGQRPALFSLAAFGLLLVSFAAVKYLMPSVHRFI